MSALPQALTTTAKVKTYLGITDSASDSVIELLINQATMFIENYCGGRKFLSQAYVDIVDTKNTDKLFFEQYPVTALTEVAYRSGTISAPVWVAYSVENYLLYAKAGYVKFFNTLPVTSQGIRLSYTAGYLIDFANETTASHTLPFELTMACTELVAYKLNTRQSQGISSQSTEGQSVTFKGNGDNDMPMSVKQVLAQYQTFRYAV